MISILLTMKNSKSRQHWQEAQYAASFKSAQYFFSLQWKKMTIFDFKRSYYVARELFLISLFLKIYLLRSMDRAKIRVKVWRAGVQKVHVMMR